MKVRRFFLKKIIKGNNIAVLLQRRVYLLPITICCGIYRLSSSSTASSGIAPTFLAASFPSLNRTRVGIAEISKEEANSLSSAVSTFPILYSGCSSEIFSRTGAIKRQGPQYSAQKSTSTVPLEISELKLLEVNFTVGIFMIIPFLLRTRLKKPGFSSSFRLCSFLATFSLCVDNKRLFASPVKLFCPIFI